MAKMRGIGACRFIAICLAALAHRASAGAITDVTILSEDFENCTGGVLPGVQTCAGTSFFGQNPLLTTLEVIEIAMSGGATTKVLKASGGDPREVTFVTSTSGFDSIQVSWDAASSVLGSGERCALEYSVDGTSFFNVVNFSPDTCQPANPNRCNSLSAHQGVPEDVLPVPGPSVDDLALVYFKFVIFSTDSTDFCYIDNLRVSGDVIPTGEPTTSPTKAPVTPAPTDSPVTPQPSEAPTATPTESPTTPVPSNSPVTPNPTLSPVTPEPTEAPTTSSPTGTPTTSMPTGAPTTSEPTTLAPTNAPVVFEPPPPPADLIVPIAAGSAGVIGAITLAACVIYRLNNRKDRGSLQRGPSSNSLILTPNQDVVQAMLRPNEKVKLADQTGSTEGRAAVFVNEYIPKKRKTGELKTEETTRPSSAKPSPEYLSKIKNEPGVSKSLFRPSQGYLNQFTEGEEGGKGGNEDSGKKGNSTEDIEDVI